jgi:hypothetical protein
MPTTLMEPMTVAWWRVWEGEVLLLEGASCLDGLCWWPAVERKGAGGPALCALPGAKEVGIFFLGVSEFCLVRGWRR